MWVLNGFLLLRFAYDDVEEITTTDEKNMVIR